ncbi:MAG: MATE family efflux transporter [Lachnospiraceae bacterium]|nr:MATE family efflux transporter [Lachnospiraceae bacterium]
MKQKIDMLNGSIWDKLLKFALPLAATGILQQLFNAADIAIVGRFVGKNAMAAVGSNSSIIALIVNLFVGISLGANVVIANLTGQGNTVKIEKAAHTAVVGAVIAGVIAAVVGEIFAPPILRSMGVPEEIYPLSMVYLRIYLAGMPFILLYNVESAIFRSQGDTRTPLICLLMSGLLNVLLNLFFVNVVHMSAGGVALATILSNLFSAILLFVLLTKQEGSPVRLYISKLGIEKRLLVKMLKIGVPAGIQGAVFSLSNVVIQSAVNSLGGDIMAASAAAFNIEIFAFYLINSFGQAATTFVGQNYGAHNMKRCRRISRITLLWDLGITISLSAIIYLLGAPLLSIFNNDPVIIEYGLIRLKYILLFEGINVFIEILSGSLRGYGHSAEPAAITFIGVCGVRILWVFTVFSANPSFGLLMAVYPVSWLVTAFVMIIAYFVLIKKIEKSNRSL